MKKETYDIAIIGGGCAGLASAMYAGRFNMKTLVLSGDLIGGTITLTDTVENYPGFKKISGLELAKAIKEHALEYEIDLKEETLISVERQKDLFFIKTNENKEYYSKTVLFATGTKFKKLEIKGEDEFLNNGVHYCALCDGFIYKDKVVCVVGGSDSAAKEALLLTQYAKKVYIVYRGDKIRPEPIYFKRIQKNKKIEIINKTNIIQIIGNKNVNKVLLDNLYKGEKELLLDAVFVAVGHIPLSEHAKHLGVKTNKENEIIIDRESKTNIKGVFAAGDVVNTKFKQAIVGVGEGVVGVYSAYTYVNTKDFIV